MCTSLLSAWGVATKLLYVWQGAGAGLNFTSQIPHLQLFLQDTRVTTLNIRPGLRSTCLIRIGLLMDILNRYYFLVRDSGDLFAHVMWSTVPSLIVTV